MGFQQIPAGLVLSGDLAGSYQLTGQITVGTLAGLRIDIDGVRDAILFYDSSNDLVASLAPAAGTDAFGNAYPTGLKVGMAGSAGAVLGYAGTTGLLYFPGVVAGVSLDAKLQLNVLGSGTAQRSFLTLGSAVDGTQLDSTAINAFASSADGTNTAKITLTYTDPTGVNHSYITLDPTNAAQLTGLVTGLHPGTYNRGTPAIAETWQNPVFGAGWTTGTFAGGVRSLHYRLDADGYGFLVGTFHSNNAAPAATICTLPSGYFDPTDSQPIPVLINNAGVISINGLLISSTGAVSLVNNLTAANVDVWVDARYRVS